MIWIRVILYVRYYNTTQGTWWNCDDDTVTQYPGYPINVYDYLSIEKPKKVKESVWMYQI